MNKTAIGLHPLSIRIGAAIGLFLIIVMGFFLKVHEETNSKNAEPVAAYHS